MLMGAPAPGVTLPVKACDSAETVKVCGELAPLIAVTVAFTPPKVMSNGNESASPAVVTQSGPELVRTLIDVAPADTLVLSWELSVSMWQMSSPVEPVAAARRITFHGSAAEQFACTFHSNMPIVSVQPSSSSQMGSGGSWRRT